MLNGSVARDRFFTLLFGVFGSLALALAALGIYGVLAYSVSQRTREIGVRMALGARRSTIHRLVVAEGLWATLAGLAVGLVVITATSRLLESLLFEVRPTEPVVLAAVAALLAGVAAAACYIPARKATGADPSQALRQE
jgi:putative ABC transport system permease protein